jgi:hypothetical protein
VRGVDSLSRFDEAQRNALAMLFLELHRYGFVVAGVFWGLWLFPLGLLVYRSGFIPRLLGILLMIACFAYLANSFTSLVLPEQRAVVSRWMDPLQLAEVLFMLWLLVMGAKPRADQRDKPIDPEGERQARGGSAAPSEAIATRSLGAERPSSRSN